MTFVMFLLGLLYVAVMAALIAAGVYFAFVFVLAAGLLFVQYWFSTRSPCSAWAAKGHARPRRPSSTASSTGSAPWPT